MITSIAHNDTEAIENILKLHSKNKKIDLDPTYSKGNFYKKIQKPKFCFDIEPQIPGVMKADVRKLPLDDNSVETIIFDPPFLATTGPSLLKQNTSNRINRRFGVYPNEVKLFEMYVDALKELYRVCKPGGILIFKCQDKVSSGKQYFSHCFIYNKAIEFGWLPIDLFILLAKHRIVADWQKKNQKHARKFHCFYFVFQKPALRKKKGVDIA
jgi:tRNA G10  N-methylase Trm11